MTSSGLWRVVTMFGNSLHQHTTLHWLRCILYMARTATVVITVVMRGNSSETGRYIELK